MVFPIQINVHFLTGGGIMFISCVFRLSAESCMFRTVSSGVQAGPASIKPSRLQLRRFRWLVMTTTVDVGGGANCSCFGQFTAGYT